MWKAWSTDYLVEANIDSEVSRLKRGEPEAFEAVLAHYKNRLYRYLLRLARQPELAEDLFQQTWVRVMTRIHRFDANRPFEPWLFAVARNVAMDHLRKKAPESLEDSYEPEPVSKQPDPYDRVLQRERKSAITEQLDRLPFAFREALTLRFEEEMSFDEIAEILSCPLSTAKSRVRRGLEILRRRMGKREGLR